MDIFELVQSTQLKDVLCVLAEAGRVVEGEGLPEPQGGDASAKIDVNAVQWGSRIEVWFMASIDTPDAHLAAAYATIYERDSDEEIPEPVQREFIERVAVMAAIPYLRETTQSLAARLRVPVPVLPVLRQGEFKLGSPAGASPG